MKNKRNTYILLVVVLIIWGLIAYKIISSLSSDDAEIPQQNTDVSFHPKPLKKADTFNIKTHERDPFLGTIEKPKKPSKPRVIHKEPEIEIPISYSGFIKDQNTGQKVFFVHINNQQYLMKVNEVIDNVKLVKGNENEITVSYNKNRKTIKLTPQ